MERTYNYTQHHPLALRKNRERGKDRKQRSLEACLTEKQDVKEEKSEE
jgi:hypothetical protein